MQVRVSEFSAAVEGKEAGLGRGRSECGVVLMETSSLDPVGSWVVPIGVGGGKPLYFHANW